MSKITISELRPVDAELFEGSQSFMSELTDAEMDYVNGGGGKITVEFLGVKVSIEWD